VTAAARLVLRDWSTGKLPRYALPPKADVHSALDIPAPANATDIYGNDENVLAQIPSRAERRRATGVVRMAAAARETRRVDLAAPWTGVNADADGDEPMDVDPQNSAEADEDAVGEEGQDDEDEDDPEDQDDEDQEDGSEEGDEADEAVVLAPASGKRKRSVTLAVAPSAKKVVFAASRSSKAFSKSSAPATIGSVLPPRASAPPKSALKARPSRVTVKPKLSVADARKVRRQVPTKTEAKGKPAKAKVQAADAGKGAGMYDFKEFF
jgi:nuclear GTP-binding protein